MKWSWTRGYTQGSIHSVSLKNSLSLSKTNHIHLQFISLPNWNWLFHVLITVERGGWVCRADRRRIYASWGIYVLTRMLSTPFAIGIHLQEACVLLSACILFSLFFAFCSVLACRGGGGSAWSALADFYHQVQPVLFWAKLYDACSTFQSNYISLILVILTPSIW